MRSCAPIVSQYVLWCTEVGLQRQVETAHTCDTEGVCARLHHKLMRLGCCTASARPDRRLRCKPKGTAAKVCDVNRCGAHVTTLHRH